MAIMAARMTLTVIYLNMSSLVSGSGTSADPTLIKSGQTHTTTIGSDGVLSPLCQAAVTLDPNLPNEYCRGNCVGWSQKSVTSDEFHTHCLIDQTLLEFATGQKAENESCFSTWTPTYTHILEHSMVNYPGECQSNCQNHEKCAWFSILKDKQSSVTSYQCLLLDSEAVSIPLATVASGHTEECQLDGTYSGMTVDCAFGSNLCLTETVNALKPLDAAIIGVTSDMHGLSGPKYCRGSSNNVADSICSVTQDILTKHYNKYRSSSSSKLKHFQTATENFHGTDHLFGARTIFSLNRWNRISQGPKRKYGPKVYPFIDEIINPQKTTQDSSEAITDMDKPTIMR